MINERINEDGYVFWEQLLAFAESYPGTTSNTRTETESLESVPQPELSESVPESELSESVPEPELLKSVPEPKLKKSVSCQKLDTHSSKNKVTAKIHRGPAKNVNIRPKTKGSVPQQQLNNDSETNTPTNTSNTSTNTSNTSTNTPSGQPYYQYIFL